MGDQWADRVTPGDNIKLKTRINQTFAMASNVNTGDEGGLRCAVLSPERSGAGLEKTERSGLRICVLDPDPGERQSIAQALTRMGHQVLSLDQVIGCSNQIRRFQPDMLIVDVKMPSISGVKLVQVLRRNLISMPVLILYSDMEEDELAEIARVVAPNDFLVKNEGVQALAGRVFYHWQRMAKA